MSTEDTMQQPHVSTSLLDALEYLSDVVKEVAAENVVSWATRFPRSAKTAVSSVYRLANFISRRFTLNQVED